MAATASVERYTRPDGTLIWRDTWPGMDGSDDGYESFVSFPLFYLLGGGEHVHQMARREWNAVTWQFIGYGQVWREHDAHHGWMHQGESSTYIKLMNKRMVPGDGPLNLNSTSLVTSAYLYGGEEKYRPWVLDYLGAWRERTERNHGTLPSNTGPSGVIGERMNGKWWGGYCGWR